MSLNLADLQRPSALYQMQCALDVFVISKKPEVHPIFNHLKKFNLPRIDIYPWVNSGTRLGSATWRPLHVVSPCQSSMKRVSRPLTPRTGYAQYASRTLTQFRPSSKLELAAVAYCLKVPTLSLASVNSKSSKTRGFSWY